MDQDTSEKSEPIGVSPAIQGVKFPTRWWQWLGMLLGPAGIVLVYATPSIKWHGYWAIHRLEIAAIVLASVTVLCMIGRALISKQLFYIILASGSIAILFREIHWDWTHKAIYVALVGLIVWGVVKRNVIFPWLDQRPGVRAWFITTTCMYALALLIQRRVFRGMLPNEEVQHIPLEEVMENIAHFCLLVLALLPARIGKKKED